MKTDPIFYFLFQSFPAIFFELIGKDASEAHAYQFTSVELKQIAFRIDGVFLPQSNTSDKPIYFVEVQFQKDSEFYSRFFSEIFLYLRQYAPSKDWRAVVIYPRSSIESKEIEPYRVLLESPQVQRVYLNQLGEATESSLGIGIVQLVVETPKKTPSQARHLLAKANQEVNNAALKLEIIQLIEMIVLYKFPQKSRQELEEMLGLNQLKQTKVYQEALAEGKQVGELTIVVRLLKRRLGSLEPQLQEQIQQLSSAQVEELAEALLEFSSSADLVAWLQNHQ